MNKKEFGKYLAENVAFLKNNNFEFKNMGVVLHFVTQNAEPQLELEYGIRTFTMPLRHLITVQNGNIFGNFIKDKRINKLLKYYWSKRNKDIKELLHFRIHLATYYKVEKYFIAREVNPNSKIDVENFTNEFNEILEQRVMPIMKKFNSYKAVYEFGESLSIYGNEGISVDNFYRDFQRAIYKALVKAPDTLDYLHFIFCEDKEYIMGKKEVEEKPVIGEYEQTLMDGVKEIYYDESIVVSDVKYKIGPYYRTGKQIIESIKHTIHCYETLYLERDLKEIEEFTKSGRHDLVEGIYKLIDLRNNKTIPEEKQALIEFEASQERRDAYYLGILEKYKNVLNS